MNPGDLRNKIMIQKLTTTQNENGFEEEKWVDFKTTWSKIENLYGKEFWAAKAIQSENTIKFTIRYIRELDSKNFRIKFDKGRIFNIIFIDDVKWQHKYLEIKVVEVK